MASTIQVPNETHSQASRITKEGKKITYELNVIQEPERARACGSGAKSSADRRPVDPPPIVQLIVKENGVDVTFQYNASFFLFATLEHARHIAQPRVPPSPASVPVLTGTPVAGMAYLDRPYPAGYFIFPDLSVRHEGKYRLSFSLYEELKEQKDMDAEEIANLEVLAQTSQHVSHRLEVKSKPFTVFSAKKFPGLAESTTLSRTVAEQGCRVRIRRDVRMRRREGKSSRDGFDDYDEGAMEHARHSRTPDAYGQPPAGTPQPMMDGDRPRSVSNASVASYSMPRRPSMEQMSQGYQQQYTPQMASQPSQSMYPPPMPYSATQQQQYQPTYQQPQQSMMQPPQMPYQPPAQQYSQQPPMPMSQNYYVSQNQFSQQQAPVQQPAYDHHSRHSSIDYSTAPSDYRRSSLSQVSAAPQSTYAPLAPPTSAPYPMDTSYTPTTQTYASSPTDPSSYQNGWSSSSSWSARRAPSYSNDRISPPSRPSAFPASTAPPLAPIHTLQPLSSAKNEPTSPSYAMPGSAPLSAESVHSPGYQELPRLAAPVSSSFHMPGQLANGANNKRAFSTTFDTHHMEQPLRYGARPNVTGHDEEYRIPQFADGSSSEGESPDASAMSYRRADGTERKRRVPLPA